MESRKERHHAIKARRRVRPWHVVGVLILAFLVVALGSVATSLLAPLPMPTLTTSSLVYARGGQLIGQLSPQNRVDITYKQIPKDMINAIVATEDVTFWTNWGINPKSIVRAALADLTAGRIVQGGSTITQQLAKNLYLTDVRSLTRKFEETLLTLRLASHLSKRQIITDYLNTVYFGEGAYGLQAAAKVYFNIPANQLTLSQASLLAGLVNAPSALDPYANPKGALARRAYVLQRMVVAGYISKTRSAAAAATPLQLAGRTRTTSFAPYFMDYVMGLLQNQDPALALAVRSGGYRVYTTLSYTDQGAANWAMAHAMPVGRKDAQGVTEPEGALIALDPQTGGIAAMVGGRNYVETPYNRAIDAMRQTGSTFKLFLYSALLADTHYTAASVMNDAPISFPGANGHAYRPENAGGRHLGVMTVRHALQISDNVVAVKWADLIGMNRVIAMARSMGVTVPIYHNLTAVLGSSLIPPIQLASAYATLPAGGIYHAPIAILRVVDPQGQVVFRQSGSQRRVLSPQVAYVLTRQFETVLGPYGTGAGLASGLGFQAAGKTGTTNNDIDGWFSGYSSNLQATVWVGDDNPNHSLGAEGAATAGPVWASFMARAENANPPPNFTRPRGVVKELVSSIDGLRYNGTGPAYDEYFVAGTQPRKYSPINYTGSQTGPWIKNPNPWFFANHSAVPGEPLYNWLMGFTHKRPAG